MNLALLLFVLLLSQVLASSTASDNVNDYDDEEETVETIIDKELARNKEAKSNAFTDNQDQLQGPGQPLPYKPITVHIPQYGKVIGRREEGIDIWRGIPYAGACLTFAKHM